MRCGVWCVRCEVRGVRCVVCEVRDATWHGVRSWPIDSCNVDDKLNVSDNDAISAILHFDVLFKT